GNAFRDGLTASVNTEQIQYARAMLLGRAPSREDIPCTRCSEYQKMRRRGAWLALPRLRNWSRRYVPTIAWPTLIKIWGVYCRAQRWLPKRAGGGCDDNRLVSVETRSNSVCSLKGIQSPHVSTPLRSRGCCCIARSLARDGSVWVWVS